MLWQNFLSPELGTKFQREVPEFPENRVYDRWKEAPTPKTSTIRSTVSIEHRLVTDTDTDGHRAIATTHAIYCACYLPVTQVNIYRKFSKISKGDF